MLLSHPNYPLKDHLTNTMKRALKKYVPPKLKYFNEKLVKGTLKIIALTHDFGKATSYFQRYIRGEKVKSSLKRHSAISFLLTNWVIRETIENNYYQLFSLCVKNHHSFLSNPIHDFNIDKEILEKQFNELNIDFINKVLDENKFPVIKCDFDDLWDSFRELEDVYDEIEYEENNLKYEFYFLYIYLFSLLISSDKEDVIFRGKFLSSNLNVPDSIECYIKTFLKKNKIDYLRTKMFFEVAKRVDELNLNHKIYSLNAPTGMGKTLTVFNFALKLANRIKKEKKTDMRIIYCLPFLSIIDQNYEVLKKALSYILKNLDSDMLLKHHHLSEIYYKVDEEVLDEDKALHLIETWNSKIIVTTFMQLFYSIFSNKNKNLKKFQSLSNSIIILDEIQAIPYKYWFAINKVFSFLAEEYNIYFVLCTATLPMIFKNNIEILKNKEEYFKEMNRIKMRIHKNEMNLKEFIDLVSEDIQKNPHKDFLIVLNTIRSSKEVYQSLKEMGLDGDFYYLSTNIYPKERLRRIKKINKNKNRKIIVSTQLIEAGVDISVDIVYRDIAPLDCLNQTAGRCNRHNEGKKGIVNIVKLIDDNGKRFSSYIYENHLITKTEELLNDYEIIEEKEFLRLNNLYFKKLSIYKDKSKEILKTIENFRYEDVENKFKLIENIPSLDLFVCVEDEAKRIWKKYEEIKEIKDVFKRRKEFLKIKKDFYDYVISVPEYALKGKEIPLENLDKIDEKYYDRETGFRVIEDKTIIL
ncbi:CRISPR-associated helicase/endonuclease Cas3 [Methanocaldococcus infernus]|uniref:CRISPR-associated helicase Cas3 n=1 Tax=Methanocaldococcus infernus (strain DSM 11812 / JCM 15783 / ME) TaxID=573063 RepID=D5VTE4_METIM|nr:CRISPR-associated helicase/endonuclease Cas3 [Methanocaldococcus infernus]ADG13847.1 CRISPR-associated helicase Cas3 [Methanocaldococcus infernus ME]